MGRRKFAEVVDCSRSDGYGHGVGCGQHLIKFFDELPFGVHVGMVEDVGRVGLEAGFFKEVVDTFAGDAPCGCVGYYDRAFAGEHACENFRHGAQCPVGDEEGFGVGCPCKGFFYIAHG